MHEQGMMIAPLEVVYRHSGLSGKDLKQFREDCRLTPDDLQDAIGLPVRVTLIMERDNAPLPPLICAALNSLAMQIAQDCKIAARFKAEAMFRAVEMIHEAYGTKPTNH